MTSELLWGALALMLVFEGLFPFFNPVLWRRTFERLLQMSDAQIRYTGLAFMLLGLLILSSLG